MRIKQKYLSVYHTLTIVLASALFCSGCDFGPTLVPISGQIKIDGKPLAQGTVTVWAKDYRPAFGVIESDGRFQLTTHELGDGCVEGSHPVTVNSELSFKGDTMKYFIPRRYADPKSSGISITVDAPRNDWVIDLTWQGDSHQGPYVVK